MIAQVEVHDEFHDFRSRQDVVDHLAAKHAWAQKTPNAIGVEWPVTTMRDMDGRFIQPDGELLAIHRELHLVRNL